MPQAQHIAPAQQLPSPEPLPHGARVVGEDRGGQALGDAVVHGDGVVNIGELGHVQDGDEHLLLHAGGRMIDGHDRGLDVVPLPVRQNLTAAQQLATLHAAA